jgi:mycothiol synthase
MNFMLQPYQEKDLPRVLRFVGKCLGDSSFCNWHPGDIVHWMSNSHRGQDLEKHFWLYEKSNEILALAHLPIKQSEFALIVLKEARDTLDLLLLQECLDHMQQRMQQEEIEKTSLSISVAISDKMRIENLIALGFEEDSVLGPIAKRLLSEPFPETKLPEGFSIRSVEGEHESVLLAEVHKSAFGHDWKPEEYLNVMQTPGFDIQRELVVVAPDGCFAAFLVYWLDPVTKSGLFEPVGCHKDFRRRGLTKALMLEGLKCMKNAGMETVLIGYNTENEAAHKLYTSVGFKRQCDYMMYSKDNLAII